MNIVFIKQKLKGYEGLRLNNYLDSLGDATIGYGHWNLEGYKTITQEKAEQLFNGDVQEAIDYANELEETFEVGLPDKWQNFLAMMMFQLGPTRVKKFKKMIAALNKGWYSTAIKEVRNSLWYRQTTRRVEDMLRSVESK